MITPTQMYWLVKLDDMRHVLSCIMWLPIVLAVVFCVMAFATFMMTCDGMACDGDRETKKEAVSDIARLAIWCVSMLLIVVALQVAVAFVPSTKQMAAIIVVPKIANSEKVQTVGNQLYDLAVEWMNELKPKNGKRVTQ